MKRPRDLARVHVPGAHVARRPQRRVLLRSASGDDEVLINDGWRGEAIAAWHASHNVFGIHVDDAVVAKLQVGFAGLRIDREEPSIAGTKDNLRGRAAVAGPIFHATRSRVAAARERVRPHFFAGGRVDGHHAAIGRGHVHKSVDHQRRDGARAEAVCGTARKSFGSIAHRATGIARDGRRNYRGSGAADGLHVIHPGHLELVDVGGRNLGQRRKSHATGIVAIGGPFFGRVHGAFGLR